MPCSMSHLLQGYLPRGCARTVRMPQDAMHPRPTCMSRNDQLNP